MSLSKTTWIGPFVRDDSRDSKPAMDDEEDEWYAGDTMLIYVEGEMPWMERECMRVGDVRKYTVRLSTGKILVHEWNGHESHAKFMNDIVLAKNNDEIGLMFSQGRGEFHMGFKHAWTLGDQTDVTFVWFYL